MMYSLFHNGIIHTLDFEKPAADALLVQDGRIIYAGQKKEVNLPEWKIKRINLRGKHIYPGFIDCHTHISSVAMNKDKLQLDGCLSLQSALEKIKKFASRQPAGAWISGSGWNANIWKDGIPHRDYLDKIIPAHPVALYNKDGHGQWLNSKAMQLCGFNSVSDTPAGGKLARDENGVLTGLIYEKACDIVNQKMANADPIAFKNSMHRLLPELYALGITSVHSCESMEVWHLFQELNQQQELGIRICMHPPVEHRNVFIASGLRSGYGDEWLRLGGLKYFIDGSLGSQTAEMFCNYSGLNHAGMEVMTATELDENLTVTSKAGLSATIHAIGDKANSKTLDALEKINHISLQKGLRHRIEHAQILRQEDIERFARLNITASMQPLHIADDVKIAEKYLDRRTKTTYAVNSLLNAGCRIVFGSDMPVADPDPLKGIRAAVGRRYGLDRTKPSWHPEQAISAIQALVAYTRSAAYASYEDSIKGSLMPGKLADFIALSHDLSDADEQVLEDTRVDLTVLGGRVVYQM